jgi:hypothetical protein
LPTEDLQNRDLSLNKFEWRNMLPKAFAEKRRRDSRTLVLERLGSLSRGSFASADWNHVNDKHF